MKVLSFLLKAEVLRAECPFTKLQWCTWDKQGSLVGWS